MKRILLSDLPKSLDALKYFNMILKAHRMNNGYDSEELYFEKLNRDLISKLKSVDQELNSVQEEPEQKGATLLQFKVREKSNKKAA